MPPMDGLALIVLMFIGPAGALVLGFVGFCVYMLIYAVWEPTKDE